MGWPADIPASAHLFVPDLSDGLEIGGEDGHHLARVLRLRPGETVTVADGSGTWRPYRVAEVRTHDVRLESAGASDREPALSPRFAVAFALTKGDKPELVIQKLTELGVDHVVPVIAARSVSRPDAAKAAAMGDRWRRVAREAARQCRRASLPTIEPLAPLDQLAGHPGLVVAERGGSTVGKLEMPPGRELVVLIGPEGGLTDDEVKSLNPWARVHLAPHILRAETAAIAAAALLGAHLHST